MDRSDLDEVRALAREGQTIQAVKRYRELTGAGLADAKAAVEALQAGAPPIPPAPPPAADEDLLLSLVRQGRKMDAVKQYRAIFPGAGLKEAKDAVERMAGGTPERSGCGAAVLVLLAAGVAWWAG